MQTKLTLLRRYEEGDEIDGDQDAADKAIQRMATDDEIKAVFRDSKRWSYVVRDPTGAIIIDFAQDTQAACLNRVLDQVIDHVIEQHIDFGKGFELAGWRLLLWPPDSP